MALPDDVRAFCAGVASNARHVRIDEGAIAAYAESLRPTALTPAEDRDFSLQLNAINFGSGWFPTLKKRGGMSGFRTIEAGMREHAPFSSEQLRKMDAATIAHVTGQDPGHELMGLYARALNEIAGVRIESADAVEIAEQLARLPMWRDPGFYKRAQIAAADLAATGTERLTLFADNLIPHVLKVDGVLAFDEELDSRIEREELLVHGSPEEVEIRACAVHAVELLARFISASAAQLDHLLWHRGSLPQYKGRPRHRARTTAY